MDSNDLTHDQARQMHRSLFKLANHLARVVQRMKRTGFRPSDPLYRRSKEAYDAVCSLCVD